MPRPILVSVLIPTYNMGHRLHKAITSVLENTLTDIEVVCYDDGSTDDTTDIIDAFVNPDSDRYDARVRYFWQENQGKAVALNQAITQAQGQYVTVLDADDDLPPESLALRYAAATVNKEAPADLSIGSFSIYSQGQQLEHRPLTPGTAPQVLLKRFQFGTRSPFHMNACLIHRSLLDRVGPFDPRLRRTQDVDYAVRLLLHAKRIVLIEDVVYHYQRYPRGRKDRLAIRFKVLRARATSHWKNASGAGKVFITAYGVCMDLAKLVYELRGDPQVDRSS